MAYFFIFIVFSLLICSTIIIHELGHYTAAKLLGVKVDKVTFGLPKGHPFVTFKFKNTQFEFYPLLFKAGIEYAVKQNALESPENSAGFISEKSIFEKSFITLCGPLGNFAAAFGVIMCIGIIWNFIPVNDYRVAFVSYKIPVENKNVFLVGDNIKTLNGISLNNTLALKEYFRVYPKYVQNQNVRNNALLHNKTSGLILYSPDIYSYKYDSDNQITLLRGSKQIVLSNVKSDEQGALGIKPLVTENFFTVDGVGSLFKGSIKCFLNQTKLCLFYLGQLLCGNLSLRDLRGFISIFKISFDFLSENQSYRCLWLCACLAVKTGLLNLIPLPAFDGGKILITLLPSLVKKKLNFKKLLLFNTLTLYLCAGFLIFLTINDIFLWICGII